MNHLLISRYVSINESYPAILDVATGDKRSIPSEGQPPYAFGPMRYAADSKSIYLSTDARGEFLQLARVDAETLRYTWLTEGIKWDVEDIAVDPHSGRVAFTVNEDGSSALYLLGKRSAQAAAGRARSHHRSRILARQHQARVHAGATRGAFGRLFADPGRRATDPLDLQRDGGTAGIDVRHAHADPLQVVRQS